MSRTKKKSVPLQFSIQTIRQWVLNHPIEIFFVILILGSALLFWNPFPRLEAAVDQMQMQLPRSVSVFGRWLAYEGGSALVGMGLVVAAGMVYGLRMRASWLKKNAIGDFECPACSEKALKRIRRTLEDRRLNQLGLPVRRYRCSSCEWVGRRTHV